MARDSQRSKCYKWDSLLRKTYKQIGLTSQFWAGPEETVGDRNAKADALFLIRYVLADYGIDPNKVKVDFRKTKQGACANSWKLSFNPNWCAREVVYHEICHVIMMNQPWLLDEVVTETKKYKNSYGETCSYTTTGKKSNPIRQDPGHGPIFVRLLAEVISFYEQIPLSDLLKLATKDCGLKVAAGADVPKRLAEDKVVLDPKYYPVAA